MIPAKRKGGQPESACSIELQELKHILMVYFFNELRHIQMELSHIGILVLPYPAKWDALVELIL